MDLVKFLRENHKLQIQYVAYTLKVMSCRTLTKKKGGTRRKDCSKRLCHNDLNCPQRLIFSCFSVIVDNFSRCGIVVYSSFSSSGGDQVRVVRFYGQTKLFLLAPCPSTFQQLQPHGSMLEPLKKYRENELNTCFQQIIAMGSYTIGLRRAWCSRKASEICSSLS
jgi:hypothetical protein